MTCIAEEEAWGRKVVRDIENREKRKKWKGVNTQWKFLKREIRDKKLRIQVGSRY